MDMAWRKCVTGMVALVCALAGTCAQAQESLFLEELWRAAMEDAVFSVDGEGTPCYNGHTRIGPQTAALVAGLF